MQTKHMTFEGPEAVGRYRAVVIAHALLLYANTGIKVNRSYTPTAMLRAASDITGNTYKRGEYVRAHDEIMVHVTAT